MEIINANITSIHNLCKKHGVSQLFVFGSILSDRFNSSSDIDLVVDFADIDLKDYARNYYDFKNSLEKLFHKKIDLLEHKALRNPFLKSAIDTNKKLIYEDRDKNMAS